MTKKPTKPNTTKADVFSVKSFIKWLEKQPPKKRYNWAASPDHNGGCLIHRYLSAHGKDPVRDYRALADLPTSGESRFFDGDVAMPTPWTYGGALKRALQVVACQDHLICRLHEENKAKDARIAELETALRRVKALAVLAEGNVAGGVIPADAVYAVIDRALSGGTEEGK